MPTLVTSRARPLSGAPAGRLARRWTRSNAYRLARDSSPMMRSASASSSAAVPFSNVDVLGQRRSVRAPCWRRRTAPCSRSSSWCLAKNSTPSHMSRSISGRMTVTAPSTTASAHASDRSRKSAGSKISSAMPSSRACAGLSVFWVSGFCDDHLRGRGDADQVRQQLGAAPAGHQTDRDLGQRERGGAGGDGPVVAVQRHLEAAAHRRTVDERERRDRESLSRLKTRCPSRPSSSACSRSVSSGMPVMSAPTQKMYGLPVSATNVGAAATASSMRRLQARQAAGAERVGLGVVEAVVQGDERGAPARRQVDEAQQRLGHDLVRVLDGRAHLSPFQFGFSQITDAPMPMPTHMAVRP